MGDEVRIELICPECKLYFDLRFRIPKSFTCGYTICLECLSKNYMSQNNDIICRNCNQEHTNIRGLTSKENVMHMLLYNAVYCSIHINRAANSLVLDTMECMCEKCDMEFQDQKISISYADNSLDSLLIEKYLKKLNVLSETEFRSLSDEFSKMSNQEKVDKIRDGLYPNHKEVYRSIAPKGIIIQESNGDERLSYLYRFLSVMPPVKHYPDYIFLTKPWVIEHNQIEAVSFRCNKSINLTGIGLGQALNHYESSVEWIEITQGNRLYENSIFKDKPEEANFTFLGEIQDFYLTTEIEIKAGVVYTLMIKIKGELLYRGNPYDLKEVQVGSDGSVFDFFEPQSLSDYYINGQHDVNGPIVKFIYRSLV